MLTIKSSGCFEKRARRYSTKGPSGSSSAERAVTSEWSVMSNGQDDCRSSSARIDLAYSLQGLKSRPKEWSNITRFGSAAATTGQATVSKSRTVMPAELMRRMSKQIMQLPALVELQRASPSPYTFYTLVVSFERLASHVPCSPDRRGRMVPRADTPPAPPPGVSDRDAWSYGSPLSTSNMQDTIPE
jgi:hypothetical protein